MKIAREAGSYPDSPLQDKFKRGGIGKMLAGWQAAPAIIVDKKEWFSVKERKVITMGVRVFFGMIGIIFFLSLYRLYSVYLPAGAGVFSNMGS